MWIALMSLTIVTAQTELPQPALSFDFKDARLAKRATSAGRVEIVPGKDARAARLSRPDLPPDLTGTVYQEKGQHCGFPSLIRLQNGELLAHFREGPGHVGRGVIRQIRSTDKGKTWSKPVTIFEDSEWDSRSHSTGIQLASGTILLGFYRHDRKHGFPLARALRSTDGGKTYDVVDLPNPYTKTFVYNIGRPIQLDDGTVLMPFHGDLPDGRGRATGIIRSTGDGRTWGDFSVIAAGGRAYYEANILMLPNGELLAMNRTEPEPWMWQCRSSDGGYTWTEPKNSGLQGDVGELLQLASGNIMCAYRSQAPHTSDTRASVSRDNGHTWSNEIVLDPNGGDRGYTSSIQFPDGRILTLNYSTKEGCVQIRSRLFDESAFGKAVPRCLPGHIKIPYSADLPFRESLTLAAWIKPGEEHQWQRIFWKDRIFSLYLMKGRLDGWVMDDAAGTAQDAVSEARIPIGQWTHVAMTYSADDPKHQVRLYINGEEAAYASVEKTSGDHLIRTAKRPLFVSTPEPELAFDGLIDKVRVYSESLNADQIRRLVGK